MHKQIRGYLSNIPRLKSILKNNKYDIIHAHYGLCGIVSIFARNRNKESLVVSFMGDDIIGSHNAYGRFTLKGKLFSRLNRFFAKNNYDFIITKSSGMASKVRREHNLAIIPNGVDLDKYYSIKKAEACKSLNFPLNKKIVFFAGDPGRSEKIIDWLKDLLIN